MTNHAHDFTARQISGFIGDWPRGNPRQLPQFAICACGLSEPMAQYLGQHPETERGTVETDMGRVTK